MIHLSSFLLLNSKTLSFFCCRFLKIVYKRRSLPDRHQRAEIQHDSDCTGSTGKGQTAAKAYMGDNLTFHLNVRHDVRGVFIWVRTGMFIIRVRFPTEIIQISPISRSNFFFVDSFFEEKGLKSRILPSLDPLWSCAMLAACCVWIYIHKSRILFLQYIFFTEVDRVLAPWMVSYKHYPTVFLPFRQIGFEEKIEKYFNWVKRAFSHVRSSIKSLH